MPAPLELYFYYPQIKKLTGAERLILALAAHIAANPQRPAHVTIVTHYFAPECRPAVGPGVRVISGRRRLDRFGSHYLNAAIEYLRGPALLKWVSRSADAVCFFGPPSLPSLWWARRRKLWRARPCLYFCYEPPRFIYSDSVAITRRLGPLGFLARPFFALYKQLDRAMVGQADAVLANGAYGATLIEQAYGRRARIITHGVDFAPASAAQIAAARAHYNLPADQPVVASVNHLHPRKRIDLFIDTIARLKQAAVGLIVGKGPEQAALQAQVAALGLSERIIFAGFVPEDELPAIYGLADVYLHTGKQESFGLSVIEALALGVPVVSVDEGGPRDTVLEGQSGYLVPAEPAALAVAVDKLLADTVHAAAMGRFAAADISSRFTWQQGAADFRAALDEVISD
jgi:glycosyltransferase involved in cell wall biosynthesis